MKIAVSANGKEKDSLLDPRFGRCDYFHIFDTDKNEIEIIRNNGSTYGGGAGIAASNQIIDNKIDVVITGSLGPNAFDIIVDNGIKAYKCDQMKIDLVLEKYKENQLEEIKSCGASHQG